MIETSAPWGAELALALAMTEEAGAMVREARSRGALGLVGKVGFEIVTEVDLAVDRHIAARISEAWPDHRIVSEENDERGESAETPTWIVDPLDGTANFASGLDHVAVAVGLALGGGVQLGVVHAPFLGETFWAVRGQGAWRNGTRLKLETEPALSRAAIATGFPHQRTGLSVLLDRLERLLGVCGSVRVLGAPALDICWVADGRLTAFLDRIQPWDLAAAGLIAQEAGALVSKLGEGQSNGADYLVAPPAAHAELIALLES